MRSKRHIPAFSLAACATLLFIAGTILLRWMERPLFAEQFRRLEFDFLPQWHFLPCEDAKASTVLVDVPSNQIVVLFCAPGISLSPVDGSTNQAMLRTSNGFRITIDRRPGVLTIIAPDRTARSYPLLSDQARTIHDRLCHEVETGRNLDSGKVRDIAGTMGNEIPSPHVHVEFIGLPGH